MQHGKEYQYKLEGKRDLQDNEFKSNNTPAINRPTLPANAYLTQKSRVSDKYFLRTDTKNMESAAGVGSDRVGKSIANSKI